MIKLLFVLLVIFLQSNANAENVFNLVVDYGDCATNLRQDQSSYNHQVYVDIMGDTHLSVSEMENFKFKARYAVSTIYSYSGCESPGASLKLTCQEIFVELELGITQSDFICKAETLEGDMFITEDMSGFMNIIFQHLD